MLDHFLYSHNQQKSNFTSFNKDKNIQNFFLDPNNTKFNKRYKYI